MTAISGPIRPKRSTTAGESPLSSELVTGELAINTADGKLFTKHVDGTVKELSGEVGGGAVDSVNGETGVVSLGVQDMDDFRLQVNTASSTWVGTWNIGTLNDNQCLAEGEAGPNNESGSSGVNLCYIDSEGVVLQNELIAANNTTVYFSINGGQSYTSTLIYLNLVCNPLMVITACPEIATAVKNASVGDVLRVSDGPIGTAFLPLSQGDVIRWDEASAKFIPSALPDTELGGSTIDQLSNVQTIKTPSWSSKLWPPSTPNCGYRGHYAPKQDQGMILLNYFDDLDNDLSAWFTTWNPGDSVTCLYNGVEISTNSISVTNNQSDDCMFGFVLEPRTVYDFILANPGGVFTVQNNTRPYVIGAPEEGDVLQWDEANQEYRPGVPPTAPISTVNGQTGAVDLGVQDMNDFKLVEIENAHLFLGSDLGSDDANYETGNGWGTFSAAWQFFYAKDSPAAADLDSLQGSDGVQITLETADYGTVVLNRNVLTPATDNGTHSRIIQFNSSTFGGYETSATSVLMTSPSFVGGAGVQLADGDIMKWNSVEQAFMPFGTVPYIGLQQLKDVTAASTDFTDFQARIAALTAV